MASVPSPGCEHCGLPVPEHRRGAEGELFCCAGCEAVYYTLHEAGLERFYELRQVWAEPVPVQEAPEEAEGRFALFDDLEFLGQHSEFLADGTRKMEVYLEGVHCAGCLWLIERMPRVIKGVVEARFELSKSRLTLRWQPSETGPGRALKWLEQFGLHAYPVHSDRIEARSEQGRKMLVKVGICWAIAANVMLLTIAVYAGLSAESDPGLYRAIHWVTFGLTTISLWVGGSLFFRRAWGALRMRRLSMDAPISLGILVGWGHSSWVTFQGVGEVWFDSIAVLIAALLTARYLQVRGSALAADAAERLVALLPRTARRVVDGVVEVIGADRLEVGDLVEVRAGDVVPADGVIQTGASAVSRSVLTGESRAEPVALGEALEAGTTNLQSPLRLRVTAVGEATRVGRLMQWVETRGRHRAPVVQLADRLGSVFIFFVLVMAAFTAVLWWHVDPARAVGHVVALLVIACPCALGMATPLALTVGLGQAARRGIHIKHDDVIEPLSRVTDVVFDKTGTLTEGRPRVAVVYGDEGMARAAAALEERSGHPMAAAILSWASGRGAGELQDVEEVPGAGIKGRVGERRLALGRPTWFGDGEGQGQEWVRGVVEAGYTPVAVAEDGEVRAVLGIGDAIRDEAAEVIEELRGRGVRVHLLSGDDPRVVRATAKTLGIDEDRVRGGATPEGKLEYLKELRERYGKAEVAMVGDGVNDAAALQDATIGIAVQGGSEASLVAADVFLIRDGLRPLSELLGGSRQVMRVIHRNLIGSGLYNVFGIGLAAAGFITPLLAAVLMPVSSLAVVASSILQRSFESEEAPRGEVTPRAVEEATPAVGVSP